MKKFGSVAVLASLFFVSLQATAQEEKGPWSHSAIAGLNLSQTSLVNWSEGGTGSLASNVYLTALWTIPEIN